MASFLRRTSSVLHVAGYAGLMGFHCHNIGVLCCYGLVLLGMAMKRLAQSRQAK